MLQDKGHVGICHAREMFLQLNIIKTTETNDKNMRQRERNKKRIVLKEHEGSGKAPQIGHLNDKERKKRKIKTYND
jgi:hypothetical protein